MTTQSSVERIVYDLAADIDLEEIDALLETVRIQLPERRSQMWRHEPVQLLTLLEAREAAGIFLTRGGELTMKTEWTQEPHTTVRWALFEALRGADKASTVDYWDVVTENLIQGLDLYQAWTFLHSVFNSAGDLYASQEAARAASEHYGPEWHLASRLTSDWKRVDSND